MTWSSKGGKLTNQGNKIEGCTHKSVKLILAQSAQVKQLMGHPENFAALHRLLDKRRMLLRASQVHTR